MSKRAELSLFGEQIHSVFQLLGQDENDISYSVGYCLANSPAFLEGLLRQLNITSKIDIEQVKVKLQDFERGKGFTDFEIIQNQDFHIIIEAKRGWVYPGLTQLEKYSERESFVNSNARQKLLVVFNESTPEYTRVNFNYDHINGINVSVISWQKVESLAKNAMSHAGLKEKWILKDLIQYLKLISTMQQKDSTWTYVVSLGSAKPEGWSITFQEIVENRSLYFHPIGGNKGGWPSEPPNYIAFRYKGKLQSIHHIDSYTVFNDPSEHFQEIPSEDWGPCYLYSLGPAIRPSREVPNGPKILRSMRVWAALDLLLTSKTIQEARDLSKLR